MKLSISVGIRLSCLIVLVMTVGWLVPVSAQIDPGSGDVKEEKPDQESAKGGLVPAVKELREISLGMTVEQVKKELGKPDVEDKAGMLFTPSKTESVQIGLDPKGAVRTIALIYTDGDKNAPTFEAIFGYEVEIPDTNGNVYKMVRYPDAGYWVSYSRSNPGDKATTIVTMRRLEP